jgi:hypothetical protein
MTKETEKRNALCGCGNDIYEKAYSHDGLGDFKSIWKCMNCHQETPRQSRKRKTNRQIAGETWEGLKAAWKATDDALEVLVAEGKAKGGAILVHGSTFNFHMEKLLTLKTPTRWELGYHTKKATEELQEAQAFCNAQAA